VSSAAPLSVPSPAAILGNNHSCGYNGASGAFSGGITGGVAGGAVGNSLDHQRGTLHTSETQATTTVIVEQFPAPPPLLSRVIVAHTPRRDAVWFEGYWAMPPSLQGVYVAPHWARRDRDYVYVQGY
jgi:hypothetical protein